MDNPMIAKIKDQIENRNLGVSSNLASYSGVAIKEVALVAIVIASSFATWMFGYATTVTTMVTGVMGFLTVLAISFKPNWAPTLAPLYAILEGMFLACLTVIMETMFPGIVLQAVLITFGIALAAAFVYSRGFVTVNSTFMRIVSVAMIGLIFCYIGQFILGSFFGVDFSFLDGGIVGIGVDLVILGLATACLFMDYEVIRQAVESGADKSFEWYAAFSLLVTLVWVYIRVLDLLRIMRSDD